MKRLSIFFALFAALVFVSCEKDDLQIQEPSSAVKNSLVVLNQGSYEQNNASLVVYDIPTGEVKDVFYETNGIRLGDTGQDFIKVDDEFWVSVYGSKIIYVLDSSLKIKKTIQNNLSPRYLTSDKSYVYVTYYEGKAGRINRNTYAVDLVDVGNNPEGLIVTNGELLVANSGGMNYPNYDRTVSVIDLSSFTVTKTVECNVNPAQFRQSNSTVYLSTFGDYVSDLGSVQKWDGFEFTTLNHITPSSFDCDNNFMYYISTTYDANWNPTTMTSKLNLSTGNISDFASVPNASFINVISNGEIAISQSDYVSEGRVSVFLKDGTEQYSFNTKGINPVKVIKSN